MSKNVAKSFVNQFVALVEGDDAKATAIKAQRQAVSALKSQIPSLEGDTVDMEQSLEDAKEALDKAVVNNGNLITDRNQYVENLIFVKNHVTSCEESLIAHNAKIDFLKATLEAM